MCLGARLEEATSGEELGVEQRCSRGAAHEVVRKQGQFDVEQRALADAAHDGGHAIAAGHVYARLWPIGLFQNNNRILEGGWKSLKLRGHLEGTQAFADFGERSDFLEAEADAFEMAINHGHAVAVSAEAEAGLEGLAAIRRACPASSRPDFRVRRGAPTS